MLDDAARPRCVVGQRLHMCAVGDQLRLAGITAIRRPQRGDRVLVGPFEVIGVQRAGPRVVQDQIGAPVHPCRSPACHKTP